ncbi:MAG: helix-turn-helix domain-containing protein [Thermincolia bacterium]
MAAFFEDCIISITKFGSPFLCLFFIRQHADKQYLRMLLHQIENQLGCPHARTNLAVGKKIARIKKDITQDQVAEITGLSNPHVSNVETGSTKPSLPTIIKIANALSVSVDELLCDNIVHSKAVFEKELSELLADCNKKETHAIVEIAKTAKAVFKKTLEANHRCNLKER